MKKLISLLLALMMALSLTAGAFAEETTGVDEILEGLTEEQKTELLTKLLTEALSGLNEEEGTEDRAAEVQELAEIPLPLVQHGRALHHQRKRHQDRRR